MSLCLNVFHKPQRDVLGFNIIEFAISLQFNLWITAITYDSTIPAKQIHLLSYYNLWIIGIGSHLAMLVLYLAK